MAADIVEGGVRVSDSLFVLPASRTTFTERMAGQLFLVEITA
jgi:hypothetical protein